MNRTFALFAAFALAVGVAVPAGFAQTGSTAKPSQATTCRSTKTLDDLIKALDEAVSGPADKDRGCLREVLYPNARLSPVTKSREGAFAPHVLSVDDWIEAVAKRGKVGLLREADQGEVGDLRAYRAVVEHVRDPGTPEGKAELRGINSIQASYDGKRWRVFGYLVGGGDADGADSREVSSMSVATESLIRIEDISAAAARIAGIAVKTPLVRARSREWAARYG